MHTFQLSDEAVLALCSILNAYASTENLPLSLESVHKALQQLGYSISQGFNDPSLDQVSPLIALLLLYLLDNSLVAV